MTTKGAETILVVDDEDQARRLLARILQQAGYECATAAGCDEALSYVAIQPVSLVVTDLDMPGRSGMELVKELATNHPDVATLMVTGKGDRTIAKTVIETGAYGYMSKPLDPDEVTIGVFNALIRRNLEMENRRHRDQLEDMVRTRTSELWQNSLELENTLAQLRSSQEEAVQKLAMVAELRDDETADHVQRMSRYCALLAGRLDMDQRRVELIRIASLMHDIGKVGVPDNILLKPSPLTEDEYEIVKRHAADGYRILCESDSELMRTAATIAWTHHERWDGTGYPRGLRGEDIPIEGRIAAIADVFDALTSDRVYRKAFLLTEALEIMRAERGRHFDPELLDLFLADMQGVIRIMQGSGAAKEVMV
jgi:putative two-component system response regulator